MYKTHMRIKKIESFTYFRAIDMYENLTSRVTSEIPTFRVT